MKKLLIGMLLLLLVVGTYIWMQRDHHSMKPSAAAWSPSSGPAPSVPAESEQDCEQQFPLRQAWFGDLHIHSYLSFDAGSRDMMATPEDAYRFASGEAVGLGPFDAKGAGTRIRQLQRPLDFAAVTDHAEWLGEAVVCYSPDMEGYNSDSCRTFRGERNPGEEVPPIGGDRMLSLTGFLDRKDDICGDENRNCRRGLVQAWGELQAQAEKYNDLSSDCRFTTFHAYEYSNSAGYSKVHRNVVFRNARTPELPISSLEEPSPLGLWEKLDQLCNSADGDCEAITIPHNSNVSNGRMFRIPWRDESLEEQRRQAELRSSMEPVVEMMQIKGESECKSGMWQVFGADEYCGFEKIRGLEEQAPEDCKDDYSAGAVFGRGCQSRLDFARYALIEGMVEQTKIGVNPYRFGFAGSTDTHNATPGDVSELDYEGCCANGDNSKRERLDTRPGFAGKGKVARNPGGLLGVWSEQNTRDSLFDAMQRREVFATSGTRIKPRFFAGYEIPESICQENFAERGYAGGVSMGGVIPSKNKQANNASPLFAAAVAADPDGGLLQRLQIVKVWSEGDNEFHQAVFDIATDGSEHSGLDGSSVDDAGLQNCSGAKVGAAQLCGVWRDESFDANIHAAYYVRVLENPSCRWSWRHCLALEERDRPEACSDPAIPRFIQERAWTSPIWYSPDNN